MPILYQNKEPRKNMKTKEEITRQDFATMAEHQKKFSYNTDEIAELMNLVRAYINPNQPSCVTCQSNLRDAKTALNEYYLRFKDETLARFQAEDEAKELIKAQEEVKEYTKTKKKKDATK